VFQGLFAEVPVLAVEAVEGAGVKENSKVFVTPLRTCAMGILREPGPCPAGAHPVGYAVGGQRIVVPGELALFSRNSKELSSLVPPQTAIPQAAFRDGALIHAEATGSSLGFMRWRFGEVISVSAFSMGLHGQGKGFFRFSFQTIRADADFLGDEL
jgi:hypothetical protein